MHTAKRGEPLPINGALNRPSTKLGLELSAWMSIVFVTVTFSSPVSNGLPSSPFRRC
jgi:hypothetical protein